MALYDHWSKLTDEFDQVSTHFHDFASGRTSISSATDFVLKDECTLEGLLSRTWQAWCGFCRSCVFESCLGTTSGQGSLITQHIYASSEAHVSGAAIRAKATPKLPTWGGTNSILKNEPTWGDVDVLNRIIPRLGPANQGQLLAAFSSGSDSAKALQTIRNASAHYNQQTIASVQGIRSQFITFSITHPIQALYWINPNSSDFLIQHALDDLAEVGLAAIS